ncbi:hypothetical protein HK101_001427 [Irineochytrium annulatum]|nr:hypothetical protein HK101_001427 [Irineochytrium annulatum]
MAQPIQPMRQPGGTDAASRSGTPQVKGADGPPAAPEVQIGHYKMEKTIGQGTYGKVKLGVDLRTNEKVAIKIIEKAQIQSEKQVARLQREIRFLKLLDHPHIVKVHDVIETTDFIYIVMEFAAGGELFDYIVAHKRVKEREARTFFRMVLSAVDYCHKVKPVTVCNILTIEKNAVIHRDLKPENLLLDERKCIKIIDFGFGNNFTSDSLLDTFCGSPFYAAPEMILGKKYEGPEVDMWSLGVILFALLCGHLPFDDDNMKELYKKIASGTYTCPDYLMPKTPNPIRATYFLLTEMLEREDAKAKADIQEKEKEVGLIPPPPRALSAPDYISGSAVASITTRSAMGSDATVAIDVSSTALAKGDPQHEKRAESARNYRDAASAHVHRQQHRHQSVYHAPLGNMNRHQYHMQSLQTLSQKEFENQKTGSRGDVSEETSEDADGKAFTKSPAQHQKTVSMIQLSTPSALTGYQKYHSELQLPPPIASLSSRVGRMSVTSPTTSISSVRPATGQSHQTLHGNEFDADVTQKAPLSMKPRKVEPPRTVSQWFVNATTTSIKPPHLVVKEVVGYLESTRGIDVQHDTGSFVITCEVDVLTFLGEGAEGSVAFEIEVCRLPKSGNCGLQFKRTAGGVWSYKKRPQQ